MWRKLSSMFREGTLTLPLREGERKTSLVILSLACQVGGRYGGHQGGDEPYEAKPREGRGGSQGAYPRLQEGMQGSSILVVSHEEFMKVLEMLASLESRVEVLTKHEEELRQEVAIYKTTLSARVMATNEAPRVEVPKPHTSTRKRDAKELDNYLWHMERYFEAIELTDEAIKVRATTLYLTNNATLWWCRRFMEIEKETCTIDTCADFKREIKKQFYPKDVEYMTRKKIKHLKHTGSIRDYVKEFSSLILEAPDMSEKDLLFNFMEKLQGWASKS